MKYYVVRAIFGVGTSDEVDMSKQFIIESRWQNGYAEKYSNIVNGINKGDIIILAGRMITVFVHIAP